MSGHTPGPWDYATETLYGKNGEEPNYLVGRDSDPVAKVFKYHAGIQNYSAEANARLIAASPLMLEACEAAVDRLVINNCNGDEDETIFIIEAAIRAARGE